MPNVVSVYSEVLWYIALLLFFVCFPFVVFSFCFLPQLTSVPFSASRLYIMAHLRSSYNPDYNHGDTIGSLIHEPYQSVVQSPGYPRGWAPDPHISSQQSGTLLLDEYRASIARHCDAIHASGLHGLESDTDVVRIRLSHQHLPPEEEPEPSPTEYNTPGEWHNAMATAAYNSFVQRAASLLPSPHFPSSKSLISVRL
jgi:hypothetical protein